MSKYLIILSIFDLEFILKIHSWIADKFLEVKSLLYTPKNANFGQVENHIFGETKIFKKNAFNPFLQSLRFREKQSKMDYFIILGFFSNENHTFLIVV